MLLFRKSSLWGCYKPRHVTKWDMFLFINSKILNFEVMDSVPWFICFHHTLVWIPFCIPFLIPFWSPFGSSCIINEQWRLIEFNLIFSFYQIIIEANEIFSSKDIDDTTRSKAVETVRKGRKNLVHWKEIWWIFIKIIYCCPAYFKTVLKNHNKRMTWEL